MAGETVPDYPNVKHRLIKGLKIYLQSNAWGLMDSNLAGYSFETFVQWRNLECGIFGSHETVLLLENGSPLKYMEDHVMVKVRLGSILKNNYRTQRVLFRIGTYLANF